MTCLTPIPEHCAQNGGQDAGVSSGKSSGVFVGALPVKNSRPVIDPYRERALFPDRWSAWCRGNFHNTVQLAACFGVSEKTARMWWEGCTAPQGWAVGYAIKNIPDAARQLLDAA